MNSKEILDREFLEMRARILDLAASLDRIDRAEGDVSDALNLIKLRDGIEILMDSEPERAGRVQMLFSRGYEENWQTEYSLQAGS